MSFTLSRFYNRRQRDYAFGTWNPTIKPKVYHTTSDDPLTENRERINEHIFIPDAIVRITPKV